jgi:hypothetical protein
LVLRRICVALLSLVAQVQPASADTVPAGVFDAGRNQ